MKESLTQQVIFVVELKLVSTCAYHIKPMPLTLHIIQTLNISSDSDSQFLLILIRDANFEIICNDYFHWLLLSSF